MRVFGADVVDRFRMRLEQGDELPRRLEEELARRGCETALVVGTGSLSRVDLAVGGGRPPLELTDVELVSASCEVALRSGRPVATMRVAVASRGELHAGVLVHGVARDVLLVIDAFEAEPAASAPRAEPQRAEPARPAPAQAPAPRQESPVFSAPAASAPAPRTPATAPAPAAPTPAASSPASPSWADVAAASAVEQQRAVMEETYARMAAAPQPTARPVSSARPLSPARPVTPKPVHVPIAPAPAAPLPEALRPVVPTKVRKGEESLYEDPIVEAGDWVIHPQFGMCAVEGDDDGGGTFIRIPSGMRKSVKLDMLQVMPAVIDEQGRKVFKIEGPRRRK